MKSEHRHELQTNELAQWLTQLPEKVKENQRIIIYIAVVAVLVIISAWFSIFRNRDENLRTQAQLTADMQNVFMEKAKVFQAAKQGQDLTANLSTAASTLKKSAESADNADLAALAYIKAAELYRAELHLRAVDADKPVVEFQVGQAMANYTIAMEKAAGNANIQSIALYGQGLCQEELGNIQAAKGIYNQLVSDEKYKATVGAFTAQNRLKEIDDFVGEVAFLPAPVKQEALDLSQQQSVFDGLNIQAPAAIDSNNAADGDVNQ